MKKVIWVSICGGSYDNDDDDDDDDDDDEGFNNDDDFNNSLLSYLSLQPRKPINSDRFRPLMTF